MRPPGDVVAELVSALDLAAGAARDAARAIEAGESASELLRAAAGHAVYAASIANHLTSRVSDTLPPEPAPRWAGLDDEVSP